MLLPPPRDHRHRRTARRCGRKLAGIPAQVLARARPARAEQADGPDALAQLLRRLAGSGRATFTRHDLLRAALDVLPPGNLSQTELQAQAERLIVLAISHPALVGVTAPDVVDAPAELRRRDGSSVYEQPERERWALKTTLDQEEPGCSTSPPSRPGAPSSAT